MIRFSLRNIVGFVGSAVMTLCSIGMLGSAFHRIEPVSLHSDTINEWRLADEKNLVVVRADRG